MHRYKPDLKLIVLLRDPVARAHSHYQHEFQMGLEALSFEEALDAEPARLAGEVERMLADPRYESLALRNDAYLTAGRYLEHIEAWLRFFPRESLLILTSEDLYGDPAAVTARVVEFLGVPPGAATEIDFSARNTRDYDSMQPDTVERLARYYEEPNRRLYAFLGRDLGWTRPSSVDG